MEDFSDSSSELTTAVVDARPSIKCEKYSAMTITALGDVPLRVVLEVDEDPARRMKLLDARYASSRTVSRFAVQTQLFRMPYTGWNMTAFIDQYTSFSISQNEWVKMWQPPKVTNLPCCSP